MQTDDGQIAGPELISRSDMRTHAGKQTGVIVHKIPSHGALHGSSLLNDATERVNAKHAQQERRAALLLTFVEYVSTRCAASATV